MEEVEVEEAEEQAEEEAWWFGMEEVAVAVGNAKFGGAVY